MNLAYSTSIFLDIRVISYYISSLNIQLYIRKSSDKGVNIKIKDFIVTILTLLKY